jgi:uncharacterized protein YjiS (DUF1127 family)
MLRDAHKSLEAMSAVAIAIKEERWGDAERMLQDLQRMTEKLMKDIGDKAREELEVPKPDRGDRG